MTRREAVPAPPGRLFASVFLLQASWNYERQQGIGFGAALAAILDRLKLPMPERARFLRRHVATFNSNPVMAPWVIGAVARMESERARGEGPGEEEIDRMKTALSIHLARLGDSIVWSAARPLAAACGIALGIVSRSPAVAAIAYWALYNAFQVPMRAVGLRIGYREGAAVTARLVSPRWNQALERFRDAGALVAGAATGLAAARALGAGGAPRAGIVLLAALAGAWVLEKKRGGATGAAFVALIAGGLIAAAGHLQ